MRRACRAKVNLYLEVLGRRPDGFHEIETVMAEIDLHDDLVVERVPSGIRLVVEGDPSIPADETNLVHRAAAAVLPEGEGVSIRLTKRIPAGAGLGGGSSDAAGTLLALDRLFDLREGGVELDAVAAGLGSDVPFFLHGGVAVCRGRGEIVEPVEDVPPLDLTLVLPELHVSTRRVYGGLALPLTPRIDGASLCLRAMRRGVPGRVIDSLFNRLEEPAFSLFPGLVELRDLLMAMGLGGVHLSGSGSALFVPVALTRDQRKCLSTERPGVRTLRVRAGG